MILGAFIVKFWRKKNRPWAVFKLCSVLHRDRDINPVGSWVAPLVHG
uniref:Uncharacterized protein n=1 Tax=uncultured marine bacterium 442 TaxID=257392 RepID=Q6SH35_9BACT|nr:hypothetical protein MBMO_EBAC000-63A02.63 [uncultured marine bacterium 442]